MSSPSAVATDDVRTATTPANRGRIMIIAVTLALSSAASAATLLWSPQPERGDFGYASLVPVRDAVWAAAVLDAASFIIAAYALSLAVVLLIPARGRVLAAVGAVPTAVGGTLFGCGVVSYGVLTWYATATDAIPAEAGASLMDYFAEHPMHIGAFQVVGLMLFSLGSLLLAVALWRARSVPRWLPIAWAGLTIGQFSGLPSRLLDLWQVAILVVFMLIAGFLGRAATRP